MQSKETPDSVSLPNLVMEALSNITSLTSMELRHLECCPAANLQEKASELAEKFRECGHSALRHAAGSIFPRLAASAVELKQVARGGAKGSAWFDKHKDKAISEQCKKTLGD